jgi:ribonuclease P protein component
LTRRADFRAASSGARASAGAFVLQARRRAEEGAVRVGFTVSRQVGNAVERNRVRRRLREIVRLTPDGAMRPGHDYVLIGRRAALAADFGDMTRQFDAALRRIHSAPRGGQGNGQAPAAATGSGRNAHPHKAGSADKGRPNSDAHNSGDTDTDKSS